MNVVKLYHTDRTEHLNEIGQAFQAEAETMVARLVQPLIASGYSARDIELVLQQAVTWQVTLANLNRQL